ncbi:hypothetical protein EIP86_005077 [Pleurotus ostreatoroseus]|nr:hypothetical protein EIP86_005077 [Pleurotus ostreatoroseus]
MARIEEVADAPGPRRGGKKPRPQQPAAVKYYLVLYNLASALGWGCILYTLLAHLRGSLPSSSLQRAAEAASTAQWSARLPASLTTLAPVLARATTAHARVGRATALVQTCAALEVAHALLGWVRSPLGTVAMQVASRYYAVWGVAWWFPGTRTNPLYASMVLAWSLTEVVRYLFYALTLLGSEPRPLLWVRYTAFYALYPLGAGSEAFLIWSTLPWGVPPYAWAPHDVLRAALFGVWWPSLYVLYTHMMKQRRRVLGKARDVDEDPSRARTKTA